MTSPTDAPATENGTVQFGDVGRSPTIDRGTLAMAGLAVNLAVWALGVAVMGVSYFLDPRLRWIGGALAAGGSMWLVVLALGARWGSEGDVPLTGAELGLAVVGLVLIACGLTASGVETLRQRR